MKYLTKRESDLALVIAFVILVICDPIPAHAHGGIMLVTAMATAGIVLTIFLIIWLGIFLPIIKNDKIPPRKKKMMGAALFILGALLIAFTQGWFFDVHF